MRDAPAGRGLGGRVRRGQRQVQGGGARPRARDQRGHRPTRSGPSSPPCRFRSSIDADALTALGDAAAARLLIDKRSAPSILTPHDGEYARINGSAPTDDRLASARALARATGAVVLLKGPLTAVASPDGGAARPTCCWPRPAGPVLATAGSGDVLSGIIGAFCARGLPALEAAAVAAHVHGRAASLGPAQGLVAGDLPELVAAFLSEVEDGDG